MSDVPNEDEFDNEPGPVKVDPELEPGGTRLHRSRTKKVFGGVAGGIGERFDVDPNIVRVVFVVLALVYGLGLAIYLALWALVPRTPSGEDEAMDVDEVSSRRSLRWLRWAVLAGVIALFVIFLTNWQGHNHRIGPGLGGGVAVLWLIFLAILAVIAIRTSSKGLTFGRFLAFGFFAVISFLILMVGGFLTRGGRKSRWPDVSPALRTQCIVPATAIPTSPGPSMCDSPLSRNSTFPSRTSQISECLCFSSGSCCAPTARYETCASHPISTGNTP